MVSALLFQIFTSFIARTAMQLPEKHVPAKQYGGLHGAKSRDYGTDTFSTFLQQIIDKNRTKPIFCEVLVLELVHIASYVQTRARSTLFLTFKWCEKSKMADKEERTVPCAESYRFFFLFHASWHLRHRPINCCKIWQIWNFIQFVNWHGFGGVKRPGAEWQLVHFDDPQYANELPNVSNSLHKTKVSALQDNPDVDSMIVY